MPKKSMEFPVHQVKLLILLLIVCEVSGNSNIRCYVCTTASGLNSDRCGDDFRLTAVDAYQCPGTCQKTRGYRTEGGRRVIEITRGCIPFVEGDGCSSGDHLGISADMCYCNEELCNAGPNLSHPQAVQLLMPLLSSAFMIYNYLS